MFIEQEELKSMLYEYQIDQITEGDSLIVDEAILAATTEVRSYFAAANARRETAELAQQQYAAWKIYDLDAIFNATGEDRNPFVIRLVQRIAVYNICELANVDVIAERLQERYDSTIKTLEKIAGNGVYANSRLVVDGLPIIEPEEIEPDRKPFRMVSRQKFNHE